MKAHRLRRIRHVATAIAVIACCVAAAGIAYAVALHSYTRAHANEVTQRASLYALTLESQLARYESLPRIAALDPVIARLLAKPDDRDLQQAANAYLKAVQTNADLAAAYVMDTKGKTLAASNWDETGSFVGFDYAFRPYFIDAMKSGTGRFYGVGNTTKKAGYFLAVPVRNGSGAGAPVVGVVAIKASLEHYENALGKGGDIVLLVDQDNVVFLSSVPDWRYRPLAPLRDTARSAFQQTQQYGDATLNALSMSSAQPSAGERPDKLYVAPPGQRARWYHVHYRPVGPLGWKVAILTDHTEDERSAMFAAISAGAATALVFALIAAARLRNSRDRERQRARAALQLVQRELEQRITERTADLTRANAALEEKVDALDDARRILRDTRDTAIQAGKLAALGQMAAGITHELNQPLAAIMTLSSNAIRMTELDRPEDLMRNLTLINELAARMGKIISHVKAFARHDVTSREPVSIAESLQQALALVELHRKAAGVTVRVTSTQDAAIVLASPIRIEQVLVNLLTNAIDASAAAATRREVLVMTEVVDTLVRISIADSGAGIAPLAMPRLFEPFYTTKPSGKGLGLGLAISQAIVDEFGGRLEAKNSSDPETGLGGAVFIVELQRVTEEVVTKP
ncbi:ATP-binding protein [Burkholderia sp. Ac-20365]|uniref:sensor histidine kinase n=1 Tax=Burkholderia sp. Ac-20365 TaxID=2703897 RepID=UPI00197CAA37|nr:ATP-binding protein [Burkholderia sp. Ac-20365]MBN3762089.1 sensor histidine kinase [Burkholderia sp. Ac-20365]